MAVLLPSGPASTRTADHFRRHCIFRSASPFDKSRHNCRAVHNAAQTTVSADSGSIGLTPTAPQAVSQRRPGFARGPTFSSAEAACSFYSSKADWTHEDLSGDCLAPQAWFDLAHRARVDPEVPYWYTQACFLVSLGLTQTQVVKALIAANLRAGITPLTVEHQRRKVAFLMAELALSRADVAHMVRQHTRLLDYSVESMFQPRIVFFKSYFQVDGPALGRVVKRHPRLLWSDTDDDILAKINLLCGVVKEPRAVAAILYRQPAVLALSELTIQDKIRRLVHEFNFNEDQLSKVLSRAPSLLLRDLQCVSVTSTILRQFGAPDVDVAEACVRFPNVFGLAPDTVRRKLEFCLNTIGFDIGTVVRNPVLLALSLDERIAPRYHALKKLGRQTGHPVWMSPAFYLQPDEAFHELVELKVSLHSMGLKRKRRRTKAPKTRLGGAGELLGGPVLPVNLNAAAVAGAHA